MTSVRPLSCREESRDGSWNTNTVTTSVATNPKERKKSRWGEKKKEITIQNNDNKFYSTF